MDPPFDLEAVLADDALLDALGPDGLTPDEIRARYGTDPLVAALLELRAVEAAPAPEGAGTRPATPPRRRLPVAAAAVLVACVLAVGAAVGGFDAGQQSDAPSVQTARVVEESLGLAAAELAVGDRETARVALARAARGLAFVRPEDGRAALAARHDDLERAAYAATSVPQPAAPVPDGGPTPPRRERPAPPPADHAPATERREPTAPTQAETAASTPPRQERPAPPPADDAPATERREPTAPTRAETAAATTSAGYERSPRPARSAPEERSGAGAAEHEHDRPERAPGDGTGSEHDRPRRTAPEPSAAEGSAPDPTAQPTTRPEGGDATTSDDEHPSGGARGDDERDGRTDGRHRDDRHDHGRAQNDPPHRAPPAETASEQAAQRALHAAPFR